MIDTYFYKKEEIIPNVSEFAGRLFNLDIEQIKNQLKPIIDIFIDDIICFVEYPYVEKYYRDSYYSFFSKKHVSYERNSIRLSFFKSTLDIENYFSLDREVIEKSYFGFISLRPTPYKIIGHTYINPNGLKNKEFVCCLSKKTILVNGRKVTIAGFPFCSQDNESFTCSEATIINLFDYFGSKYPEYSIILPSQVARVLSRQSFQRQLPSQGMPTENISFVLKKLGFGSMVYSFDNSKSTYSKEEFKNLLFIYIESGIPLIATLTDKHNVSHHAVLVIGRENIINEIQYSKNNLLSVLQKQSRTHLFSSKLDKLLIMNDNTHPYEIVNFNNPIFNREEKTYYQFKSFIIPLYSKVHLEAYQFKKFFFKIIDEFQNNESTNHIKFMDEKENICRLYLTSSKSYKEYLATSKGTSNDFKLITIDISMPKFIWVGEIIKGNSIGPQAVASGIIVIDATESGPIGHLIFGTDSRYLIYKNKPILNAEEENLSGPEFVSPFKKYQIIDFGKEIFHIFENNLKGAHNQWQS